MGRCLPALGTLPSGHHSNCAYGLWVRPSFNARDGRAGTNRWPFLQLKLLFYCFQPESSGRDQPAVAFLLVADLELKKMVRRSSEACGGHAARACQWAPSPGFRGCGVQSTHPRPCWPLSPGQPCTPPGCSCGPAGPVCSAQRSTHPQADQLPGGSQGSQACQWLAVDEAAESHVHTSWLQGPSLCRSTLSPAELSFCFTLSPVREICFYYPARCSCSVFLKCLFQCP